MSTVKIKVLFNDKQAGSGANALNRLIINQQLETRIKRVVGNAFAEINNYLHALMCLALKHVMSGTWLRLNVG